MLIKIKDKTYTVRFGVGFVRELDKKYSANIAGQRMGYGLEATVPFILAGSAIYLSEILIAGTVTEDERPTQEEMDDFIDFHDDYDGLVAEVIEELKKQNATRTRVAELVENHEKAIAQKEKKTEETPMETAQVRPEPKMPITK